MLQPTTLGSSLPADGVELDTPVYIEPFSSFSTIYNSAEVLHRISSLFSSTNTDHRICANKQTIRALVQSDNGIQCNLKIYVYYLKKSQPRWTVEVQRRRGDIMLFYQIYRRIKTVVQGGFETPRGSLEPFQNLPQGAFETPLPPPL
jgi:hypothetical protein